MRTELMRQLDRRLGKIALWSAARTAPFLRVRGARRRRAVIAKFFGLGSLLQTYRLVDALTAAGYEVAFLTFASNIPFLRHLRGARHFFGVDPSGVVSMAATSWKAARALNRWRPEVYIDLELFSYYSAFMGILSNAPTRVAFFSAIRPRRFYMTHRVRWNPFFHVSHNYLEFARPLVPSDIFEHSRRRFHPEEIFREMPASPPIDPPYVVASPFASDTLAGLTMWPKAHWVRLINRLGEEYPHLPVIITGTPTDAEAAQAIAAQAHHPNLVNLAGRTSLDDFYALLAHSRLTITIDSFPFHLSTLLGRPTIGLFGPDTPVHYGPDDQPRSIALSSRLMCSPCINVYAGKVSELLCTDNQCLQRITPDEVLRHIRMQGFLGSS